MGTLMAMDQSDEPTAIAYHSAILTGSPLPIAITLQTAAGVGVAVLKVFGHVFKKRFELSGVDVETGVLAREVDTVFKPFAEPQ